MLYKPWASDRFNCILKISSLKGGEKSSHFCNVSDFQFHHQQCSRLETSYSKISIFLVSIPNKAYSCARTRFTCLKHNLPRPTVYRKEVTGILKSHCRILPLGCVRFLTLSWGNVVLLFSFLLCAPLRLSGLGLSVQCLYFFSIATITNSVRYCLAIPLPDAS